jgi:hypothetical protein
MESAIVLGVMVGAGALGGLALGAFQGPVLQRHLPSADTRSWMATTGATAAFVWLVGMLPSTFLARETWPSGPILAPPYWATLARVQLFGLAAGGLLGAAQWVLLRRSARGAGKWVLANALGWSAGLPFLYVVAAVPLVETSLVLNFVATVAVAAMGGLAMGAITGAFSSVLARGESRV